MVFDKLKDDRTKAGNIVGEILHSGGKVKTGLGLAALVLEAIIFYGVAGARPAGWRRYAPAAMLMAALSVALISTLWLEPKIHALRGEIQDFSEATKDDPSRVEFRKLHGLSMGLALLEGLLVAFTLLTGLL